MDGLTMLVSALYPLVSTETTEWILIKFGIRDGAATNFFIRI
jgi:hypothetical protein